VFDPTTFNLQQDIAVPKFATGGLLKFSDDGTVLVTRGVIQAPDGTQTGAAARIDLPTGKVAWTIPPDEYGFGNCDSIAFSVIEDRLWCGDYFGVIRGRSLTTGALDGSTIEHQRGWLSSLDLVDSDGVRYLVSFGRNTPSIGRWRVDGTGPIMRRVAAGQDQAWYSPDGRSMITLAPSDNPAGFTASIWDQSTDRRIAVLTADTADTDWIDSDRIASVAANGAVRAVDARTGQVSDTPTRVDPDWSRLARIADGVLAVGYPDGHLDIVHVDSSSPPVRAETGRAESFQPMQIAPSADGTRIYVAGNGLWVFDATDGRQLASNNDARIGSVAASRGDVVAVGYLDGTIGLLRADDLTEQSTLPGARGFVQTLRFSGDGRLLLARSNDHTVALFDLDSRQRLGDAVSIGDANADLRPDGGELSVANVDGSGVVLWNLDPSTWMSAACLAAGRNLTHTEWDTYLGDLAPYHATCPEFTAPAR
jgi:WD40 repeat protein